MRIVMLTLLATAVAIWYCVERGRAARARQYSNAATERWEDEGGSTRSPPGARDDQVMMS